MTRLSEIKSRAEAATPGPWDAVTVLPAGERTTAKGTESWSESPWRVISGPPQEIDDTMSSRRAFTHQPDADFIATSRSDVPWLLEVVERLLPAAKFVYRMNHGEILNTDDFAKIAEVGLPDDIKTLLNTQEEGQ